MFLYFYWWVNSFIFLFFNMGFAVVDCHDFYEVSQWRRAVSGGLWGLPPFVRGDVAKQQGGWEKIGNWKLKHKVRKWYACIIILACRLTKCWSDCKKWDNIARLNRKSKRFSENLSLLYSTIELFFHYKTYNGSFFKNNESYNNNIKWIVCLQREVCYIFNIYILNILNDNILIY